MIYTIGSKSFYNESGELISTWYVKVHMDNGSIVIKEFYTEEGALSFVRGLEGEKDAKY